MFVGLSIFVETAIVEENVKPLSRKNHHRIRNYLKKTYLSAGWTLGIKSKDLKVTSPSATKWVWVKCSSESLVILTFGKKEND